MTSSRKQNEVVNQMDCYYYYYSSCNKGNTCIFRHEPLALKNETMCIHWWKGRCMKSNCNFRHMELKKNRSKIPCFHETQPGGCLKEHCPFLHKNQELQPGAEEQETVDDDAKELQVRDCSQKKFEKKRINKDISFKLAEALSKYTNFETTLLTLLEDFNFILGAVKKTISENSNVFVITGEKISLKPAIKICQNYLTENGCQFLSSTSSSHCQNLHICYDFVFGRCSDESCLYGHSVDTNHNQNILSIFKLSLVSQNSLLKLLYCEVDNENESENLLELEEVNTNASFDISSTNSLAAPNTDNLNIINDVGNNSSSNKNKLSEATIWSHEYKGNVAVEEICYNSVEKFCSDELTGCPKLHCDFHFYWQVFCADNFWVNLPIDQVIALEKGYCNPSITKIFLPQLDTSALQSNSRNFIFLLKGKSTWEAEFENMELTLTAENITLKLRRLCTEHTSNPIPKPCVFLWYFLDIQNNWVEYGEMDSTKSNNLRVDVDSKSIENHYQQNPNNVLTFKNGKFSYSLDFNKMYQINTSTNVSRAVRRRPMPHIKEKQGNSETNLPDNWDAMLPEERVKCVKLLASSDEYEKIASFIKEKGGKYNIFSIERVQNPYFYRAFQNKIKEMMSLYKSMTDINILQLFHGTNPDIVPKICNENFDWRLHGSNVGQAFGRGTYFSPLASTSYDYTKPNSSGHRFMFIAKVAVGTLTLGNSSMTRPPINPNTGVPFDSTGNHTQDPSIIVKYDKQEYFPEYIVTIL